MSLVQTTSPPTVWDRVVCGIDFTAASLQAALLVARLMPASAELTLCAVADVDFSPEAIESGLGLFLVDKTIMRKAKDALTEVQTEVQAPRSRPRFKRSTTPTRTCVREHRCRGCSTNYPALRRRVARVRPRQGGPSSAVDGHVNRP